MRANFETGLKVCSTCKKELPLSMFRKRASSSDGLMYQCKDCKNKIDDSYRRSERGKIAAEKDRKRRRILGIENEYEKRRRKSDLNFNLRCRLRSRLHTALKGVYKSEHTFDLLGCSIEYLRDYLEKQFEPGMSWDNIGEWHIDHIIPCSYFDLTDPIQQRICFNFRNLQPLWAKDNQTKSNKLFEDYQTIIDSINKELHYESTNF